ncbi:hypothetical protein ACOME3_003456 [Neoechinorhynchus agilis]
MFTSHFFKAVGFFTLLANISTYSKNVMNFNVKKSGFLSFESYIFHWLFTLISVVMCDKLINAGTIYHTMARKVFTALGNFLPGIFTFLTGFVTAKTTWDGTLLFTLVLATTGFNTGCGLSCDMAPIFAGIIWDISNTFGILPGVLCPAMVGVIVKDGLIRQRRIVFSICATRPWALDKDEIDIDELELDEC